MELFRALAVLAEPPSPDSEPVSDALGLGPLPDMSQYTDLFTFQLYPFASVYLGEEGMLGGEAGDRIAGFWRALGLAPPSEADHLSVMLAMYAELAGSEDAASDALIRTRWRSARKAFLWEHLLSWLPVYLLKMNDIAPPFYQRWGDLLKSALIEDADKLGMQEQVSIHLRDSIGLMDPRDASVEDFLQSLLSPVRSGMILVRSDLARAAKRLGLGLRIGERKFVLKSLFGQNPEGTLDWLVEEAMSWAGRHGLCTGALGKTAIIWENKATAAAELLGKLKMAI